MVTTFNTNMLFNVRTPSQTAPMEQSQKLEVIRSPTEDLVICGFLCGCVFLCHGARNVFTSIPIIHLWAPSHFLLLFPLSLASISSMAKPGRKEYYELVN